MLPSRWSTARPVLVVVAVAAAIAALLPASAPAAGGPTAPAHPSPADQACAQRGETTGDRELACVSAEGGLEHLRALQEIAEANGGTRASGTAGYDASVGYVVQRLQAAGYDPTVQSFQFPYFEVADQRLAVDGQDQEPFDPVEATGRWAVMAFSGSGEVTDAAVVATEDLLVPIGEAPPNTSTSGCEPEDFSAPPEGPAIALIQRGTCTFLQKAANAQQAGYEAAVIFNEGQEGRREPLLGSLGPEAVGEITIPVVGTGYELGAELVETDPPVTVQVEATAERRETANVLATLPGQTDDDVVVVGAHLDSVPEGPGFNDNGTGSAAILEVAEGLAGSRPENPVRFAWWGAEEFGLLGSTHYVDSLGDDELDRIGWYLNFDMIGSPNFARFTYDGDQSSFAAPVAVPEGSAQIEAVFDQYYDLRGLAHEDSPFNGRSDYGPFIAAGIPAGGVFTGAEQAKTPAQVEAYGGVAGLAYDPCYHRACDDGAEPNEVAALEEAYGEDVVVGNVNRVVFGQNIDAAAVATLVFAHHSGGR